MLTKDFTAQVKAAGKANGLGDGEFEALVSAFGNVDSMGDVVMPGAFTEDLKAWEDSGNPIPVIWAHDWSDPFSHIGEVVKAEETEDGLKILAQLDLNNEKAVQVFRLLKGRRVNQFSFAYDVQDAGWATRDGDDVLELRKLSLYEVGPCLVGANQETELLSAKAQALARRKFTFSEKSREQLTAAVEAINSVLKVDAPGEETRHDEGTPDEPSQEPSVPARDEAEGKSSAQVPGAVPRRARAEVALTLARH